MFKRTLMLLAVAAPVYGGRLALYSEVEAVSNQVQAVKADWEGSVAHNITAADTSRWNTVGTPGLVNGGQVESLVFTNAVSQPWRAAGNVHWDPDEHSLVLDTDVMGTSLTWGGEITTLCRNDTGSVLPNGALVCLVPGTGPTKRVALYDHRYAAYSDFFGMVTVDAGIPVNGFGMVTSFGRVRGLNTQALGEGTELYGGTAGGYTASMPSTTNDVWRIGVVEYSHNVNGVVFIYAQKNGFAKSYQLDAETVARTQGDLASIAALAAYAETNQVTRVWESSNVWYTFSGSTITRYETNPEIVTNVTFSADFETATHETLYPQTLAWPVSGNGWSSGLMDYGGDTVFFISHSSGAYWFGSAEPGDLYPYVDAVGVASMHVFSAVTTNIVAYDLLNPPETWSYTDQTNWMEFGNAGQLWVTDLAFDAAQTLLNGHNVALDPHPGVLVKASNGSASGLTLTGNNTVNGQPLLGSLAVSNLTSQLLYTYTNATGVTTAQVWRTGGAVSTNFFSSAAATVCPTNWTRPTCWPVAAGYTVDTWLTPETNLVKILTVASPRESISFLRGPGGSFQVDWYGDGTHVSNYANNAVALFSYPPSDHGRAIPIVAGYTNGWRIETVSGWAGYNPTTTNMFSKVARMLEFVGEPVAIGAGTMQASTRRLRHIVVGTTTTLPANWLYLGSAEKVDIKNNRKIPDGAFYDNRDLEEVMGDSVTNIGVTAFQNCVLLETAHFPLCQTLRYAAFINCQTLHRLTPMPNLVDAGAQVFRNCNLPFVTITNFIANLQLTPAAPQYLDFRDNPGTPEVKTWYFGGSVSNDLEALGWKLTL